MKHQTNSSDTAYNVGVYDGFPGMQLVSVHQSKEEVVKYKDSLINFKINTFGGKNILFNIITVTKEAFCFLGAEVLLMNLKAMVWALLLVATAIILVPLDFYLRKCLF